MMSLRAIRHLSRLACAARRLNRATGGLPGGEATGDVGHRLEPHPLRGLGCQRRALASCTEEHESLVLGEDRLVILAVRIDPKLEHPARTVKGARYAALAVELADVAQVDEGDVVAAMDRARRLN